MGEFAGDNERGAVSGGGAAGGGAGASVLTPLAQQYLDQTRPWVRFMSVLIFIMAGLMVVVAVVLLLASLAGGLGGAAGTPDVLGGIGGALLAVFYVALALVYVAPGVYLARYATAIKLLKTDADAGRLEDALKHQKSFWRFVGIMSVVGLVLSVVFVGLAVVVGVVAAAVGAGG